MNGTPWTREEEGALFQYVSEGRSIHAMAAALGVSERRVERKMRTLSLSVRAERAASRDLPAEALAAWQQHGTATAVRKALGKSWQVTRKALLAAGIDHRTQPKPEPRLPDDEMRALVAQGLTRHEIAARVGVSYSYVCQRARALSLDPPRQPWGTAVDCYEQPPDREELLDAIARWGISGAAEEYEVTEEQIKRWRDGL